MRKGERLRLVGCGTELAMVGLKFPGDHFWNRDMRGFRQVVRPTPRVARPNDLIDWIVPTISA